MTLKQDKPQIEIWTDGSIQPTNPGPYGGWGAIIVGRQVNKGHKYRAMSSYYLGKEYRKPSGELRWDATSQRSEVFGVMNSLKVLPMPCNIHLVTDSMYVIRCIGNIKNDRDPRANADLWCEIADLLQVHEIACEFVRGHDGTDLNEWADRLAYNAAAERIGRDEYYDEIPIIRKSRGAKK